MVSCQLQLDKTEESHVTVTLMARLLTLSWFWLFYPFQPSFSERHDPLPSLKLHSCGTAAYTAQSVVVRLCWCLVFFSGALPAPAVSRSHCPRSRERDRAVSMLSHFANPLAAALMPYSVCGCCTELLFGCWLVHFCQKTEGHRASGQGYWGRPVSVSPLLCLMKSLCSCLSFQTSTSNLLSFCLLSLATTSLFAVLFLERQ